MKKIEKEVQKFIKNYKNGKGQLWKVILPNGHGGQVRRQGFLCKADAIAFATKEYLKVLTLNKGIKISDTHIIFRNYSLQWLEMKKKNGLADSSFMRYEDEIRLRLNPFFGSFTLSNLEKLHLRNYIYEKQIDKIGSATLHYSLLVFKSIIKQAEIDDLIPIKGITMIPNPKHKKAPPRFWDQSQVNYFLNSTKDRKLYVLWSLALRTGMRASEIAGLKWECVHFDRTFGGYEGAIEVRRIFNQKTRRIEETTKNGDRRIIPLLPQARKSLMEIACKEPSDFVFGGKTPLDSSHFNRQLQSAIRQLTQLPIINFHGLRHTFCSYLDSTGMSRRIVSEIMGHKDLNTTNLYSHVNNQMLGHEVSRWLETQSKQKTNNFAVIGF